MECKSCLIWISSHLIVKQHADSADLYCIAGSNNIVMPLLLHREFAKRTFINRKEKEEAVFVKGRHW